MSDKTQHPKEGSLVYDQLEDRVAEFVARCNLGDEIRKQSDRGAAIMAAAMVDDQLTAYIQSKLLMVRGAGLYGRKLDTFSLFAPDNALGAFGVRIHLAFAMRFISEAVYIDLLDIKDVRNRFAHWAHTKGKPPKWESLDFKSDGVRELCLRLKCPELLPPIGIDALAAKCVDGELTFEKAADALLVGQHFLPAPSTPRERYIHTCAQLSSLLSSASAVVGQVTLDYSDSGLSPRRMQEAAAKQSGGSKSGQAPAK